MNAYPIKFEPILQEKIWGGTKLNTVLHKKGTSDTIGESWEISGVQDNISVVSNGEYKGYSILDLLKEYQGAFVGSKIYNRFGNEFPLLIKYLDAKTDLSVQVHPDDQMALEEHNSFGKTEMWYIMDHEEDACVINGFKNEDIPTAALRGMNQSNVNEILNVKKVHKGDAFFIPAGKVHAIGAGVLAAEIQQTSDITYRVYDWDRLDTSRKGRELHLEQSIKAVKRNETASNLSIENSSNCNSKVLASCAYFTSTVMDLDQPRSVDYSSKDSFVIYMCVEGCLEISINDIKEKVIVGETVLIPANAQQVFLDTQAAKVIEVYIR